MTSHSSLIRIHFVEVAWVHVKYQILGYLGFELRVIMRQFRRDHVLSQMAAQHFHLLFEEGPKAIFRHDQAKEC